MRLVYCEPLFPPVLVAVQVSSQVVRKPFTRQSHLASKHKLSGASREGLCRGPHMSTLHNEKVKLWCKYPGRPYRTHFQEWMRSCSVAMMEFGDDEHGPELRFFTVLFLFEPNFVAPLMSSLLFVIPCSACLQWRD